MKRKILAAVAAGVLAAIALTSSASAAINFEVNVASGVGPETKTTPVPRCILVKSERGEWAGTACVQPDGDILGAQDVLSDGHAVALVWDNYVDGKLYRQGACVESRGSGKYGACNKNFTEGSVLYFKACTWESGPGTTVRCSAIENIIV